MGMRWSRSGPAVGIALLAAAGARAQTTGFKPLDEMGPETYLGFSGGLYPGQSNLMPAAHAAAGRARAEQVQPLDTSGNPDPAGRIALLAVGLSHTTQEFCSQNGLQPCNPWTFVGQALADPEVNHETLAFVDGARGGQTPDTWDSPDDPNYDRIRDTDLASAGLTEAQVQAVWLKVADKMPSVSLPDPNADAYTLETGIGNILRALRVRYPHLLLVFVSNRSFGGYANTALNPEPYAYEAGFAVKWIVEAQIDQMANGGTVVDSHAGDLDYDSAAPWVSWAANLWGDGLNPRCDGLIWERADFVGDGTHPSTSGEQKVGGLLLNFFKADPRTRSWFLAFGDTTITPNSGDAGGGGTVTVNGTHFQQGVILTIGGSDAAIVGVTPTSITAVTPALTAGAFHDVVVTNPDDSAGTIPRGFFADFLDVPEEQAFHDFIEAVSRAQVTAGCGPAGYCPDDFVARAQMAVFLLKGRYGKCFVPPAATGSVFNDVAAGDFAADWIEALAAEGITEGCGGGNYCPGSPVRRDQMAVFLLKAEHGSGYLPPDCTPPGLFADTPCPGPFTSWIEQLAAEQITGGCGAGNYCPGSPNNRGQMAVFVAKTFNLE